MIIENIKIKHRTFKKNNAILDCCLSSSSVAEISLKSSLENI